MIKKIFGGLLCIFAVLVVVSSIANGTLFSDQGSAAATFGSFLGTMLAVILYVLSGMFLLTFDNAAKLNYIAGFKKRSKQSTQLVVFTIIYVILLIGAFLRASNQASYLYINSYLNTDAEVYLYIAVCVLLYAIPLGIFAAMLIAYAIPYWNSKKDFLSSEAMLQEYLSEDVVFYTRTNDNFVLTSDKALFFPRLLCVIPLDQIVSVKYVGVPWELDIFLKLSNGKKYAIAYVAAPKRHKGVQDAIDACMQTKK